MERRRELAYVALAVLAFILLTGLRAHRDVFPFYDDVAYLRLGNDIRLLGGPLDLIRELYAARFAESNRHPLYVLLLSLVSGDDAAYHRRAQHLTLVLGVFALLACWYAVRRHFGARAALFTVIALAVNNALIDNASRETCEPLLVALWALSVSWILDGKHTPHVWVFAGLAAGLAYLTKGTGVFIPICFAIAFVLARDFTKRRLLFAGAFFAAFVAAASPLLVRNFRMYGSPLYTFNSRFLWIDRLSDFAEIFAPSADALLPRTPFEYLAQVTPGSVAWRAGMGLAETCFHVGDAVAFVYPTNGSAPHIVLAAIGIIAAFFAAYWLWKSERSWKRTFLLVQTAWFFAFFVFYNAVSGSSRYMLPATVWLVAVLATHVESVKTKKVAAGLLVVSVVLTLLFGTERPTLPPGFAETEAWLIENVHRGEAYAIDARTRLQPEWRLPGVEQVIVSASFRDKPVPEDELIGYFKKRGVRYVVLDASSVAHLGNADDPDSKRYFFYDELSSEDGVFPRGLTYPAALTEVWAEEERRYVVLELRR
jgi:hypothetical protein